MTASGQSEEDVRKLAGRRVLVVGDLVLDEYVTGRMTRISREQHIFTVPITITEARWLSSRSRAKHFPMIRAFLN